MSLGFVLVLSFVWNVSGNGWRVQKRCLLPRRYIKKCRIRLLYLESYKEESLLQAKLTSWKVTTTQWSFTTYRNLKAYVCPVATHTASSNPFTLHSFLANWATHESITTFAILPRITFEWQFTNRKHNRFFSTTSGQIQIKLREDTSPLPF